MTDPATKLQASPCGKVSLWPVSGRTQRTKGRGGSRENWAKHSGDYLAHVRVAPPQSPPTLKKLLTQQRRCCIAAISREPRWVRLARRSRVSTGWIKCPDKILIEPG